LAEGFDEGTPCIFGAIENTEFSGRRIESISRGAPKVKWLVRRLVNSE
jgi:hypothetical protein